LNKNISFQEWQFANGPIFGATTHSIQLLSSVRKCEFQSMYWVELLQRQLLDNVFRGSDVDFHKFINFIIKCYGFCLKNTV
jgi:hypothetical protein